MSNAAPLPGPKITGTGGVSYRCADCGQPITDEPRLEHRDGRLVAVHQEHKEVTNGR